MLTPAQLIPFLSHDDREVRHKARQYLVSAHDPAPATAEDFWAVADKLGAEEAGPYLDRIGFVPQTDTSVRRLMDELPKTDPATRDSLLRTLERLDLTLLRSHWDAIRDSETVSPAVREHLQARLDLANEPPEPLWDRMMVFATGLGDRNINETEELEADRLIEAVARHREVLAPHVLAALADPAVRDWRELFSVDVAGEMRLAESTHALLDRLKDDHDPDNDSGLDLMWDVAADALVRIGDAGVVSAITERFGRDGWGFQLSAAGVLGRIKRPESEAALLKLLPAESDLGIVASLALALVDLCPTDPQTMETLRAIAREGGYDRMTLHLDEELVSLATMTGVELPEGPEWRKRIEDSRARWAMGMSNVDQAFQQIQSLLPSTLHAAPMLRLPDRGGRGGAAVAQRPAPAERGLLPFRNASPKVGRNDPCPCGSGKKFKKCCGG